MKKKKKKHKPLVDEKITRAHHKNEYVKRLNRLYWEYTGLNISKLLPQKEIDHIYDIRSQTGRVMPAEGHQVPNFVIKSIKSMISTWLRNNPVNVSGRIMMVKDFFSMWLTLMLYAKKLTSDSFPGAAEFRKSLEPYLDVDNLYKETVQELNVLMQYLTFILSDFSEQTFFHNYCSRINIKDKRGIFICLDIYSHIPEKKYVEIDGMSRPVIRIGWGNMVPEPHIIYADIDSSLLNNDKSEPGSKLPVYIQNHALQRLHERIDIPFGGLLHFSLINSLMDPVICTNRDGAILIEYRHQNLKTGYLRAVIHEDILLIHTFLFLTNNGTPEGEKLHANTGLKKEDKIYLAIDKLSAFVASDIQNNEVVKNIFVEAGCESLFKIDPSLVQTPGEMKEKPMAMRIAHYLGLQMDEEFMEDIENM